MDGWMVGNEDYCWSNFFFYKKNKKSGMKTFIVQSIVISYYMYYWRQFTE